MGGLSSQPATASRLRSLSDRTSGQKEDASVQKGKVGQPQPSVTPFSLLPANHPAKKNWLDLTERNNNALTRWTQENLPLASLRKDFGLRPPSTQTALFSKPPPLLTLPPRKFDRVELHRQGPGSYEGRILQVNLLRGEVVSVRLKPEGFNVSECMRRHNTPNPVNAVSTLLPGRAPNQPRLIAKQFDGKIVPVVPAGVTYVPYAVPRETVVPAPAVPERPRAINTQPHQTLPPPAAPPLVLDVDYLGRVRFVAEYFGNPPGRLNLEGVPRDVALATPRVGAINFFKPRRPNVASGFRPPQYRNIPVPPDLQFDYQVSLCGREPSAVIRQYIVANPQNLARLNPQPLILKSSLSADGAFPLPPPAPPPVPPSPPPPTRLQGYWDSLAAFNQKNGTRTSAVLAGINGGRSVIDFVRADNYEQRVAAAKNFGVSMAFSSPLLLKGAHSLATNPAIVSKLPGVSAVVAGGASRLLPLASKTALPLAILYSGYEVVSSSREAGQQQGKILGMDRNVARTMGAAGGILTTTAAFALAGSVVPFFGTAAGIIIGLAVGLGMYYLGGKAGEAVYDTATSDQPTVPLNSAPVMSAVTGSSDLLSLARTG